jgi:hypothetical protein
MGQRALTRILGIIETLDPDELRQVQLVVNARLHSTTEDGARAAFHQALLNSGLVQQIKTQPNYAAHERPLVPIQGKPLSDTIIEERR